MNWLTVFLTTAAAEAMKWCIENEGFNKINSKAGGKPILISQVYSQLNGCIKLPG
jgi:hypothetical protein